MSDPRCDRTDIGIYFSAIGQQSRSAWHASAQNVCDGFLSIFLCAWFFSWPDCGGKGGRTIRTSRGVLVCRRSVIGGGRGHVFQSSLRIEEKAGGDDACFSLFLIIDFSRTGRVPIAVLRFCPSVNDTACFDLVFNQLKPFTRFCLMPASRLRCYFHR